MKKVLTIFVLLLIGVLIAQAAFAGGEDNQAELPWSKFQITLGGFIANLDSHYRYGTSSVALDVDVEEFLGLDSTGTTFRLGGFYRFGQTGRHGVALDWFRFRRSGTKKLTDDIEFPPDSGNTLPTGITVESVFNFDLYSTRYRYAFIYDDRMNINIGAGLFVMPIEFGVGEQGENFTSTSVTAPLPTLGVGFDVAITPKWFLKQSVDFLYIEFDGFSGNIIDYQVALEHKPWKHFAYGLGLEHMSMEVTANEETIWPGLDFDGTVGFGFSGLLLYGKLVF